MTGSNDADRLTACVRTLIDFRDERDWARFHTPRNLASSVSIEAAELLELFQWDDRTTVDVRADHDFLGHVRDEIADVAIYLLTLAHDLDVDLVSAIESKLVDNARRYPVADSQGRSDKAAH